MQYRCMREEDRPAIHLLWGQVFGDGDVFIDGCLDTFAGPGNVFVAEEDGAPVAVLSAPPCCLGAQNGAYLYALATSPQWRGKGVMSRLMLYAEQQLQKRGATFAALIPANGPLFEYYAKRGYCLEINLRELAWKDTVPNAPAVQLCCGPMDGKQLAGYRQRFLGGVGLIEFTDGQLQMVAQDLAGAGAVMATTQTAYGVLVEKPQHTLVAELGAAHDDAAAALLRAVAASRGGRNVLVTLPQASPLFAQKGRVVPAALVKPLAAAFGRPRGLYLRFAMDEL